MVRAALTGAQGELVIEREVIPVHYMTDLDANWKFTDAAGHAHRCEYDAADHYPTLTEVTDEIYWCEGCGDDHARTHLECTRCGETIRPGMTGPGVKYIPGMITYTFNGEPVSPERAREIAANWETARSSHG